MEKINEILGRGVPIKLNRFIRDQTHGVHLAGGVEQVVSNSMIQCFNTMIFRFFIKDAQSIVRISAPWFARTRHHITTSPYHHLNFLVLLLLLTTPSFGQAPQTMEAANDAYTNKDYDTAIQNYEQLLSEGYSSEVLHYNLGNAYYRTEQLAEAILHYEKALQVAPSDGDILHNLQVANAQQLDEMEEISAFFLSQWWKALRSRLSTRAWTTIGLLLLWGSAAGFIFWLMAKQRTQRKRGFLAGVILLALCVLPFLLALDRNRHDQHSKEAILMAKETQLHFAPDADSEAVRTIHAGLKVDLQDKISAWYKVRLPNGEVGWLPEEVVEEI